jgi:hypothetical protein
MQVGVYSNIQIKSAIKEGHIVYHPYVDKHIAGSSVDVTLGNWFYRTERPSEGGFYNPFEAKAVSDYFGEVQQAEIQKNGLKHGRRLFTNVPSDQPIIVLRPQRENPCAYPRIYWYQGPGTSTMQARVRRGRNRLLYVLMLAGEVRDISTVGQWKYTT